MISLDSKSKGTRRFINQRGQSLSIDAHFWITEEVQAGESIIKIHDTLGILPGTEFTILLDNDFTPEEVTIEVESVSIGSITLTQPITFGLPAKTILSHHTVVKGLFISPGRDITRDTIEMNRRIRVPSDTVVSYGSNLDFKSSSYFITGYQEGDSSISIGLKLINEYLDWYSSDPSYTTAPMDPEELTDITGWNKPAASVSETEKAWPDYPGIKLRRKGVAAYQEQISLFSDIEEPGYIPRLNRIYIVPIWLPIEVDDYLKTDEAVMRVLGKDLTRIRNMQALSVSYSKGAEAGINA